MERALSGEGETVNTSTASTSEALAHGDALREEEVNHNPADIKSNETLNNVVVE